MPTWNHPRGYGVSVQLHDNRCIFMMSVYLFYSRNIGISGTTARFAFDANSILSSRCTLTPLFQRQTDGSEGQIKFGSNCEVLSCYFTGVRVSTFPSESYVISSRCSVPSKRPRTYRSTSHDDGAGGLLVVTTNSAPPFPT